MIHEHQAIAADDALTYLERIVERLTEQNALLTEVRDYLVSEKSN